MKKTAIICWDDDRRLRPLIFFRMLGTISCWIETHFRHRLNCKVIYVRTEVPLTIERNARCKLENGMNFIIGAS